MRACSPLEHSDSPRSDGATLDAVRATEDRVGRTPREGACCAHRGQHPRPSVDVRRVSARTRHWVTPRARPSIVPAAVSAGTMTSSGRLWHRGWRQRRQARRSRRAHRVRTLASRNAGGRQHAVSRRAPRMTGHEHGLCYLLDTTAAEGLRHPRVPRQVRVQAAQRGRADQRRRLPRRPSPPTCHGSRRRHREVRRSSLHHDVVSGRPAMMISSSPWTAAAGTPSERQIGTTSDGRQDPQNGEL